MPISSFPRRRDYKPVTVTTDMPTLLKAAIDQNFVPVVDDRNVFIGMVRRTVLLRELYDKYTTLPPDKRFQRSHPPMKGLAIRRALRYNQHNGQRSHARASLFF